MEKRPRRLDYAWLSTEPNTFGTNEFIAWCRMANIEPMLAVNLGTRGPAEAGEYIEYAIIRAVRRSLIFAPHTVSPNRTA